MHIRGKSCILGFAVQGSLAQFSFYEGEAIQNLRGYIECHHCDEDKVHEVDHALTIGIAPATYCHGYKGLLVGKVTTLG